MNKDRHTKERGSNGDEEEVEREEREEREERKECTTFWSECFVQITAALQQSAECCVPSGC